MKTLVTIGEAAQALGVSISTLRRWEREGKLIPERTVRGHRRYDLAKLYPERARVDLESSRQTMAYTRGAGPDQQDDLERQKQVLEIYCAQHGWMFEVVTDLGAGVNSRQKGLQRLLDDLLHGRVGRLVLIQKGQLMRWSGELVFAVCELKQVEVVILNQDEGTISNEEEERSDTDVLDLIATLSERL